ncbi:hypothetical protein KKH39_02685 [Patescibacteria group bacterium]|nr:hypothetical protein [Patescibacteria group bacterium]
MRTEIPSNESLPESKSESIEYYIGMFTKLRDGYSNDVPKEIIHSNSIDSNFKIRRGWFTALVGQLVLFKEDYLEGSDNNETQTLVTEIDTFVNYCTSPDFIEKDRTEKEDVDRGDEILNKVLKVLENIDSHEPR